jgi:hypothetical protein
MLSAFQMASTHEACLGSWEYIARAVTRKALGQKGTDAAGLLKEMPPRVRHPTIKYESSDDE